MRRLEQELAKAQLKELRSRQNVEPVLKVQGESLFAKLAHASQIGLLVFAALAYFFTIKPVYDKAKLDQQIVEKEQQLKVLAQDAKVARAALESATAERDRIDTQRLAAESAAQVLERKARDAESRWQSQYFELRAELSSRFFQVALSECFHRKEVSRSTKFADCVFKTALPLSFVDSLTKKDLATLRVVVNRRGPEVDAAELAYEERGEALNARQMEDAKRREVCEKDAESREDKYSAQVECINLGSEQLGKFYREITKNSDDLNSAVYAVINKMQDEFLEKY